MRPVPLALFTRTCLPLVAVLTVACSSPSTTPAASDAGSTADSAAKEVGASADAAEDAASDATPTADTTTADASGAPTFHAIWTGPMAKNGCSGKFCHGAANPPGSLSMPDENTAYASLVNHAIFTQGCDATVRVLPGDHAKSLMWQKVAPGVQVCQGKMPDGTEGLTQAEADLIAAWIDGGALK